MLTTAHEVRRFDLTSGAGQLGLEATHFDLTDQADMLRPGANVLAIHGLNSAVDDADFLLRPTLQGTRQQQGPLRYFSRPTPGAINGLGDAPPTGPVLFSQATQTFVTPFDLVMTPPSPEATIRYTTNGDLPDENSTRYTGPLRISSSTRIRARAFEADQRSRTGPQ